MNIFAYVIAILGSNGYGMQFGCKIGSPVKKNSFVYNIFDTISFLELCRGPVLVALRKVGGSMGQSRLWQFRCLNSQESAKIGLYLR